MGAPAGRSVEQRQVEGPQIKALSRKLGVSLVQKRFKLKGAGYIELDGYSQDPLILCEAWAHIGWPRSAQLNKVMTDALRLVYVDKLIGGGSRRILLFADQEAADPFQGTGWMAQCLREYGVEIVVVNLSTRAKFRVKRAQKRQDLTNKAGNAC